MITKAQLKLFKSLAEKKHRNTYQLFLVEGEKSVLEVLDSDIVIQELFYTNEIGYNFSKSYSKAIEITAKEMQQMSSLSTPPGVMAVCAITKQEIVWSQFSESIQLYLASIRDPGNLGTIIRLADWFGLHQIFCSEDTAEVYNPKVIQASMGSFTRVKVHYLNLKEIVANISPNMPIYASSLEGQLIDSNTLLDKGLLIIGNEANGISADEIAISNQLIRIPGPLKQKGPESLNAAMATSIFLSAFKKII
jgi:RNA methyltransferase, TrmH family